MKFKELLFLAILVVSCDPSAPSLEEAIQPTTQLDSTSLSLHMIEFFNQWEENDELLGNWIYRRQRLDRITKEIYAEKPDVIFANQILKKSSNENESDEVILSYDALKEYHWELTQTQTNSLTDEVEYGGFIIDKKYNIDSPLRTFKLEETNAYIQTIGIKWLAQSIVLIHIQSPQQYDQATKEKWDSFLEERITILLKEKSTCHNRYVIAGYLPESKLPNFKAITDEYQNTTLTCENCQTATNDNKLYTSHPSQKDLYGFVDQYWVSKKTKTFSTNTILLPTQKDSTFEDDHYSWQRRYGLKLKVRLPICPFTKGDTL